MNSSECPKIVGDDEKRQGENHAKREGNSKIPATDGRSHDRHRTEDHQSFVGSRITACQQAPGGQPHKEYEYFQVSNESIPDHRQAAPDG